MKTAVITFPGSNCDEDAAYVCRSHLGWDVRATWHQDQELPRGTELVILPGGFSYGDALRSGALARFSAVMRAVMDHAERGGFVLGICNGFQILLEAGLLPGAMLQNASQKFVCRVEKLRVSTKKSMFSSACEPGQILSMPVAHHEGRYFADRTTLDLLAAEDRIILTYEHNPNGSARDIAGITNKRGNVFGLMPHPERAFESALGGEDGRLIFQSLERAVRRTAVS